VSSKFTLALWPNGRDGDQLAGYLARGVSTTLALQLTSRGLAFLTILLLSRTLGATGYGQYAYIMACIGILGSLAAFGMPQTVAREVAAFHASHNFSGITGITFFALLLGMITSCALAILYSLYYAISVEASITAVSGVFLAAFLLPLNVLTGALGGVQQGLKRISSAQFPAAIVVPLVLLLCLLFTYRETQQVLTVRAAVAFTVAGSAVALAVAVSLTLIAVRRERHGSSAPRQLDVRRWLSTGFMVALMSSLASVQAQVDIIMLNWLAGPESTGLFHVATRSAQLLSFLLSALIVPLGPIVAELYARDDRQALKNVVNGTIRLVFAATLPLAVILILAGEPYLALFGSAFKEGSTALAILAIAQLVNVGAGPVQMLLVMTGQPQHAAKWLAASSLANVGLNLVLVPSFGLEGAAVATATSVVIWNVALQYETRKRLGIPIGLLS
jgi:O-antigen/teichoic acid export membrane protein